MPALFDAEEFPSLPEIGVMGSGVTVVSLCEQNTQEWFGLRFGVVTASSIANIVTNTGQVSKGAGRSTYLGQLTGDTLLRRPQLPPGHSSMATERGHELEPRAIEWYEKETGRAVHRVGFVFQNELRAAGCSPDGLCEDRGLEVKCPLIAGMIKHIRHITTKGTVPTEYMGQIQFSMWVTGLQLWDFILYTPEPEIPSQVVTVEADPQHQAAFNLAVPKFLDELQLSVEAIKRMISE